MAADRYGRVVLVVAPIIVGRILSRIMVDANQFTHKEQEQIEKELAEIKAMLRREREGGHNLPA